MTRQIEKPGQVADYGFKVDGRMSPSGDAKLGRRRVLTVSGSVRDATILCVDEGDGKGGMALRHGGQIQGSESD